MKPLFCFAFCLLAAPRAHAADESAFYLSAALGSRGEVTLNDHGAKRTNNNKPRPFALAGGYQINRHLALEAGYVKFGGFKFDGAASSDLDAVFAAAKGSYPLGESFSLFGKVGVARHQVDIKGVEKDVLSAHDVRAMFGAGVEYRVSDRFGISIGITDYGTTKTRLGRYKPRQAELGLNLRF